MSKNGKSNGDRSKIDSFKGPMGTTVWDFKGLRNQVAELQVEVENNSHLAKQGLQTAKENAISLEEVMRKQSCQQQELMTKLEEDNRDVLTAIAGMKASARLMMRLTDWMDANKLRIAAVAGMIVAAWESLRYFITRSN